MKITIQHYDQTSSIEVPDGVNLDEFQDVLSRILGAMWEPDQVDEIMRVNDYDNGYKSGFARANDKEESYL
jgi:hypothetical protein